MYLTLQNYDNDCRNEAHTIYTVAFDVDNFTFYNCLFMKVIIVNDQIFQGIRLSECVYILLSIIVVN